MVTHPSRAAALGCLLATLLLGGLAAADPPTSAAPAAGPQPAQPKQPRGARPLDPRGRMDDHPTNKPARYYLWHDREGWHLRSCSRLANKFEGTLRLDGGTFRKCRPIGIDPKGRLADQWQLNKDRNELKFVMNTGQSFDGFDFTVDDGDAQVEFDLLINGKPMPARVFVGRDGEHPREGKFKLPADPEKLDSGDTPAGSARREPGSPSKPAAPVRPAVRPRPR